MTSAAHLGRRPDAAPLVTGLLLADACAAGVAVALRGFRPAVVWAGAHLVCGWWLRGAREGRRLGEALVVTGVLAVTTNFLTSWLGLVAGVPVGAVARDVAFLVLVAAGAVEFAHEPSSRLRLFAYLALAGVAFVTLGSALGLAQIVGARTYVLYPIILLGAAWALDEQLRLAVARALLLVLLGVAVIAFAEVITSGGFLDTLGLRPDSLETSRRAATPNFAGFRRGTGGLGNFLEFGLLMSIGLLLCRAVLRGRVRPIMCAVFAVAAFLSWSRLAWVLVLVVSLVPLAPLTGARTALSIKRLVMGTVALSVVVGAVLAFGPREVARDRLFSNDRLSVTSNETRADQFREAFSVAGLRLTGAGPGSQGAAADRGNAAVQRITTDNGYLIWLLELGWAGVAAIVLLTLSVAAALCRARAWWALVLLGMLAFANALFAAADSRVVLAISFIVLRLLWTPRAADRVAGE